MFRHLCLHKRTLIVWYIFIIFNLCLFFLSSFFLFPVLRSSRSFASELCVCGGGHKKVKVWFQNRRTKHKRMQQEDDTKGEGSNHSNNMEGSYDDEEEIDMDDCSSEDEHGMQH